MLMTPAWAQTVESICQDPYADPEAIIPACTHALKSALAIANFRNRSIFYGDRALAYMRKGQADLAFSDFNQSIQDDPNNAASYNGRGQLYFATGKVGSAIDDFTLGLKIQQTAETFFNLGNARFANGETDRALEAYNSALRLQPSNAIIYARRGYAYFAADRNTEAISDLTRAISLNPRAPYPVVFLHVLRMRSGTDDSAEFQKNAQPLNITGWPAPLVAFFLDSPRDADDALKFHAQVASALNRVRACEYNFFIGEWMLSAKPELAPGYFRTAEQLCPPIYYEGTLAHIELQRQH